MLQAIAQRQTRVRFPRGTIHRLEKEILEIEVLIHFRRRTNLWEDKFEFMPGSKLEFGLCFGTNADPVDVSACRLGSVGLNRNLKTNPMKGIDQGLVQLQERFAPGTDHKRL